MLQRFVAMALEALPVDLVWAPSMHQARAELAVARFSLVLCDLMLPDGSGRDLIEEIRTNALAPRVAVFSAGVTREVRSSLQALGVWRILEEPLPVTALEACVAEAIAPPGGGDPDAAPHGESPPDGTNAARHWALVTFFAGDTPLHDAFMAQSRVRFGQDLAAGDAAMETQDLPALRRQCHSLKTVLPMVGWPAAARRAACGERAAAAGDRSTALAAWSEIRIVLANLTRPDDAQVR